MTDPIARHDGVEGVYSVDPMTVEMRPVVLRNGTIMDADSGHQVCSAWNYRLPEILNLRRDMVLARRISGRRPRFVPPTWMVTPGDVAWA